MSTFQVQCLHCGHRRLCDPPHAASTACPACNRFGWVYPPGEFPVPLDRSGIWGQVDRMNVLPLSRQERRAA